MVDLLRQGQGALLPEGDAGAVGTRVVAQLQVHQIDVPRQMAIVPEGDAITLSRTVVQCRRMLLAFPERLLQCGHLWVASPLVYRPIVGHHVALVVAKRLQWEHL